MKINKRIGKIFFFTIAAFVVTGCQNNKRANIDTILKGKATIYVDESVFPIIEDAVAVFETQYDAKFHLIPQSEYEIVKKMYNDTAKIAVLSRDLSKQEVKLFENKKIISKSTPFATDGIALIRNKSVKDTLISLQSIVDFLRGEEIPNLNGLVFDNPNSSTVRYISDISGTDIKNQRNVYALNSNEEVIKYVAAHEGVVGILGINWIFQPPLELQEAVDNVTVLSVKGRASHEYIYPSQENLTLGTYPLARRLYLINCQGYSGLGMGFASFLAGERGQRIILKSGLVPERFPSRKIIIRNSIIKNKNK